MNLTLKMLAWCPVATLVFRVNGLAKSAGLQSQMFKKVSSEPEASCLPLRDQLVKGLARIHAGGKCEGWQRT
jgi:hypothetical protein